MPQKFMAQAIIHFQPLEPLTYSVRDSDRMVILGTHYAAASRVPHSAQAVIQGDLRHALARMPLLRQLGDEGYVLMMVAGQIYQDRSGGTYMLPTYLDGEKLVDRRHAEDLLRKMGAQR